MSSLLLAFQNSMHVDQKVVVDVMTNETEGSNHQARHGIEHPHMSPSYPIMVSYDSLTLSLYLQLGHNALDH
jgi:hypothetical protein